jgi:hypothetical protein
MAKPPALNIYVTILYFLGLEACYKKSMKHENEAFRSRRD